MLAHRSKVLRRHPHQQHKERERIATATICQHFRKLFSVSLPGSPGSLIIIVGSLVHGQFLDLLTELDGCLHSKRCAGGDTKDIR